MYPSSLCKIDASMYYRSSSISSDGTCCGLGNQTRSPESVLTGVSYSNQHRIAASISPDQSLLQCNDLYPIASRRMVESFNGFDEIEPNDVIRIPKINSGNIDTSEPKQTQRCNRAS